MMRRSTAELTTRCGQARPRRVAVAEGAVNRSMVSQQGGFDEIDESQEDDQRTRRIVTALARSARQEPARFVTRHRRVAKANQLRREWTERSEPLHAHGDCRGTRYPVAGSQQPAAGGRLCAGFL